MAHEPAKLAPVLNLGCGNEQPDDEQQDNEKSFPRFLDLPPELRVTTCEKYMESSGTVPSTHTQSALTRISRLIRQEALPIFYQHSTFAATINIWSRHNDRELNAHLDRSSDSMLDNVPRQHRSLVRKIKLLLVFNLAVKRRFEFTFDLTQWHDFASAIRFERVMTWVFCGCSRWQCIGCIIRGRNMGRFHLFYSSPVKTKWKRGGALFVSQRTFAANFDCIALSSWKHQPARSPVCQPATYSSLFSHISTTSSPITIIRRVNTHQLMLDGDHQQGRGREGHAVW